MKKYFTTGVAILLPIILTIAIVNFLINFLTAPFLATTESLIRHLGLFHHSYFFLSSTAVITLVSKLLIILFLFGVILTIGFAAQHFLIEALFAWGNYFIHRVPLVNKIYKVFQDTIHILFSPNSKSFSQVALVPYPHPGLLSIGLVAGGSMQTPIAGEEEHRRIAVFVSGTPNPSVGYLLFFKPQDVVYIDMKVEQAMKAIVSCGAVMPNFEKTYAN